MRDVWGIGGEVVRALSRLRRVEHAGRARRPGPPTGRRRSPRHPRRVAARPQRGAGHHAVHRPRRGRSCARRLASCRAAPRCSPVRRGSASRRSCCSCRAGWPRAGHVVLYVAAEEAVTQVRRRAERLDAVASRLWMAGQGDMPSIRAQIGQVDPAVVVVDSVQSVFDPDIGSSPGAVSQVRGCASELVARAREERSGRGAGRARHQGRRPRRPPRAGAPRRHRPRLRRRPAPLPADAARPQAPPRRHRRAGPARDDGDRPGVPRRPQPGVHR